MDIKTWASVVPLIGGLSIGARNVLKTPPDFIYSWSDFKTNDQLLLDYWKEDDIPFMNESSPRFDFPKIDLVATVPPCSALSALNVNSSSEYSSIKWLYESSAKAFETGAKVVVGENAPGLFTKKGYPVVDALYKLGQEENYSMSVVKINSNQCGVPQNRTRTFFIFWKSKHPRYVSFTPKRMRLDDYLNETPLKQNMHNEKEQKEKLLNHPHYLFIKDQGYTLPEYLNGKPFMSRVVTRGDLNKYIGFVQKNGFESEYKFASRVREKTSNGKNYWDSSSILETTTKQETNAIIGKSLHNWVHPEKDRFLTDAELMSLMGIPHDFVDVPNLNLITQNVTVQSAESIIQGILDSKESFSNGVLYQDLTKHKESYSLF